MNITKQILEDFFAKKGGAYRNKEALLFQMKDDSISVTTVLKDISDENGMYTLHDELSAEKFLQSYNVNTLKDLDLVKPSGIWLRYLDEGAEVIYTGGEGNAIHFRKFRSHTMIFSLDMHYYTEVNEVLHMREHFKDYVEENKEEILNNREERIRWDKVG